MRAVFFIGRSRRFKQTGPHRPTVCHFGFCSPFFFPAVTGFTQGVSMSGDLKDPGKSLPLGTFLAVGVSIVVYFSTAVVFSGALSNQALTADYTAMHRLARFPVLIDAGVIAATLSSAMASFLGAPRILQSLSADRIFPFLYFFRQGSRSGGQSSPSRPPGRRHRRFDHRPGQPEPDRPGRVHVFSDLIRIAQLCDLLRSPGIQPFVSSHVQMVRQTLEPFGLFGLYRGHAGHRPGHGNCGRIDHFRPLSISAAHGGSCPLGRQPPCTPSAAGQRKPVGCQYFP